MSSSATSLTELAAPRYVLRWARPMPRPRGPEVAIRRGLDLVAPDRPGAGLVARIPVKRPALLRYRSQRDQVGFVDGFGAGVHSVMTSVGDDWVPIAHFVRHGQPDRSEPGFKYRLEDAEHEELALIESDRSLSLVAGEPRWTCLTTDGRVIEARPHPGAARPVRDLSDRMRRAVRRRAAPGGPGAGTWTDPPMNGRGGWVLIDAGEQPLVWLTPPSRAHSTSFAVVGPDGTSLEDLDPTVLLFAYFVLFGELQRYGGPGVPVSSA